MTERQDWCMEYSVPYKWPFWLFVSVEKISLVECLERHSLMKHSRQSKMMAHPMEKCYHTLSATSYCPHVTPGSGESLTWWCFVNTSCHAGLSFVPLQNVDGDHSRRNHSHQDLDPVTMRVGLGIAQIGQLVPMHAAGCSMPRTSDIRPHCVLE